MLLLVIGVALQQRKKEPGRIDLQVDGADGFGFAVMNSKNRGGHAHASGLTGRADIRKSDALRPDYLAYLLQHRAAGQSGAGRRGQHRLTARIEQKNFPVAICAAHRLHPRKNH